MIWHIFEKDWKLEWRLALAVALVQAILSGILWKQGVGTAVSILGAGALLARGFLIVQTVHNDPIPGMRQDWLVRPIRRSELLAAKILFTVLVVQGPVLVADLVEALADGFSFGASIEAALSRSAYMLLVFCLPVLAISSLTKNLLEVLAAVVLSMVALAVSSALSEGVGLPTQRLFNTAIGWTAWSGCLLVIIGLAAAVLTVQFRRRKTVVSRWVAATGVLVLAGILMLPWQPAAFALQSRLSPDREAGRQVTIGYEANPAPAPSNQKTVRYPGTTVLRIPLSVSGLPDDSILTTDHFEMHVIDSRGVIRARSRSFEFPPDAFMVGKQGNGPVASLEWHSPAIYATIVMDTEDYLRMRDEKVRVEVDYSLTLMRVAEAYAIPAVNGNERLPGVGWCRTRVSPFGDSIVLNCMQAGRSPDCYSRFLEHTPSGRRNAVDYECSDQDRDYSPAFTQFLPDSVVRFGRPVLPFHDPTGDRHYEVDAQDIGQSQVVIRNYRTLDHFTRTVTTPDRALSQWLAK